MWTFRLIGLVCQMILRLQHFVIERRENAERRVKAENPLPHSTHFSPMPHFYTPWNFGFSDVFRGYRNVTLD